ncbi:MAG: sensor domain-containing diguanylate cyclase [Pyrinomonadaceae bacterium]
MRTLRNCRRHCTKAEEEQQQRRAGHQHQQQQPAMHTRGAEATTAATPTENELGEALLGLARCPENLSPQDLRTAFEIVLALHFAGDRKQAAQTAIAGLKRLVEADHWAIYAAEEESADTPTTKLELLVGLTITTSGECTDVDSWQDSRVVVLEAIEKVEAMQRTNDGRHVVVAPLVYAERVYGAIEVERSSGRSSAAPFTSADLDILSSLALPVACALANAERIAKAEQLSLTDDLTKLHNARYLRDFLANEVKRARRYNSPVAVIFLDLDNFKKVNDVHGHLTGSHVLSELGGVILGSVRDTDVVARYGGDEFVVVLPQSQAEQAVFVAERMRERIAKQVFSGGRALSLRVTASIGVTAFPRNASTPQQLLDSADAAMYVAKAQSKNCVRLAPEFSSQNFNENVFSQ